jgi:hypothetical protein
MRLRTLAAAVVAVAFVGSAGCASSDNAGRNHSGHPGSTTSAQAPAPALVIDVAIKGGAVMPTIAQFQGTVGKPIELRVSSDTADELHVHSHPEHTFRVEAKPNQTFTFTADVPGRVDVELHQLGRTVATIQVRR